MIKLNMNFGDVAKTFFGNYKVIDQKVNGLFIVQNESFKLNKISGTYDNTINIINKHFNDFIDSITDDNGNLKQLSYIITENEHRIEYIEFFLTPTYVLKFIHNNGCFILMDSYIKIDDICTDDVYEMINELYFILNREIQKLISTGDGV